MNHGGPKRRYDSPWTPRRWNEAYIIRASGHQPRAKVWRPDYPRADRYGRALRSHVVWWLTHKKTPPRGHVIHHINHNSLDDRPENLMPMTPRDHSRHHHEKFPPCTIVCAECGNAFVVQYNIISQHLREGRKYGQRFCSRKCVDRSHRGKRGHSYRGLTVVKVRDIKRKLKRKIPVRLLAIGYGVSISTIYAIKNGQNWGDV